MNTEPPILIAGHRPGNQQITARFNRIKKKRSRWITCLRLAKLVIYVTALVLIIRFAIIKISRPIQLLKYQMSQSATLTAQLQSLKAENEVLKRRLIYVKKGRGAVQEARRLGFVKPGEVLLVLPPDLAYKNEEADRTKL